MREVEQIQIIHHTYRVLGIGGVLGVLAVLGAQRPRLNS